MGNEKSGNEVGKQHAFRQVNLTCERCELAAKRIRELYDLNAALSLGLDRERAEVERLKAMLFSKRDSEGVNQNADTKNFVR